MNNLCNDKIDLVSFNQETDAEHANEIGISHITVMQIPEFLRKYKITNSNKKISIISSSDWDKLKDDYIKKFKNKENLEYLKEPDPIFEESNNDDIIVSSAAIELFGSDIVEID